MAEFKTFEEFWPYYLGRTAAPKHVPSTTLQQLLSPGASLLGSSPRKNRYLASTLLGITPAWFAHFAIEHNKPVALEDPVWSICADLLMFSKWLSGGLDDDLRRAGVEHSNKASAQKAWE